jgi:hypothetical protein
MDRRSQLPRFTLDGYAALLDDLAQVGYALREVERMPETPAERAVFLRHDLDFHLPGIEAVAEIEAARGAAATYFVPLTLHFNPFYPPNRSILRSLVARGHRIGLHYDLETYPIDRDAAWRRLDDETAALGRLIDAPIASIAMHCPWRGREDLFRSADSYVHPHAARYDGNVTYVSDSCRAWRDQTLLRCFGDDPPQRLLLNTHPELWLGSAEASREQFLERTLMRNTTRQHRDYLIESIESDWPLYPGVAVHARGLAGG